MKNYEKTLPELHKMVMEIYDQLKRFEKDEELEQTIQAAKKGCLAVASEIGHADYLIRKRTL